MDDENATRPPRGDWLGTPFVRFERHGSLAHCIVDRPEARNAMTGPMYFAVRYAVDVVNADPALASGAAAHVGSATSCPSQVGTSRVPRWRRPGAIFAVPPGHGHHAVPRAIRNSRKPVVSAVNGICQGGGLLMALLSDVAVVSERATFRAPELYRGIADTGYAAYLPVQIGPARARDLLFTGRTLDAAEACAWGLVTRVTEHDRLLDEAADVLRACCRTAPQARLAVKRVINEEYGHYDRMSMDESLAGPECAEGWLAFRERRSPAWVAEDLRVEGRL